MLGSGPLLTDRRTPDRVPRTLGSVRKDRRVIPQLALTVDLESRSIGYEVLAESGADEARLLGDLEARREWIERELPGAFGDALEALYRRAERLTPAGTAL
jgi:hypothetical protein